MTRTTALATMLLMLAAFPAAAQSPLENPAPEAADPTSFLTSDAGIGAHYSGPMIGFPHFTDTRPSAAGDLAGPGFLVIEEPTVRLNHLDFGAYEPYDAKRARQILKENQQARTVSPKASDGRNDIAVNVDGTLGYTSLGTSYVTKTGPVDVRAKAGFGLPGVGEADMSDFVRSTDVRVDMKYKF